VSTNDRLYYTSLLHQHTNYSNIFNVYQLLEDRSNVYLSRVNFGLGKASTSQFFSAGDASNDVDLQWFGSISASGKFVCGVDGITRSDNEVDSISFKNLTTIFELENFDMFQSAKILQDVLSQEYEEINGRLLLLIFAFLNMNHSYPVDFIVPLLSSTVMIGFVLIMVKITRQARDSLT